MARIASKVMACFLLGALAALFAQFYFSFERIAHDKAVNADVLQPLRDRPDLPFGKVVPPNNRWTPNAFVAERGAKGNAVLILNDHYQGSDPAYRSMDGVIGDEISRQASANAIIVDPPVLSLINAKCGSGSGS